MTTAEWLARQVHRIWSGLLSFDERYRCITKTIAFTTQAFGEGTVKMDVLASSPEKLTFKVTFGQGYAMIVVTPAFIGSLKFTVDPRMRGDQAAVVELLRGFLLRDAAHLPVGAESLTDLMKPAVQGG